LALPGLRWPPLPSAPQNGCKPMFDLVLGLAVAVGIFGFLVVALIQPGKF
jgi:K+-transporting ATPase KdpF subunit